MIQLALDLQRAAVGKDWVLLESLLDANSPDLSGDEYSIKVNDVETKKYTIIKNDLASNTFAGTIPAATANGYQAIAQGVVTSSGVVTIVPGGSYTFTVTKADILNKINNAQTHNVLEQIEVTYKKEISISSVAHQLLSRAAHSAPVSVVQKLLDSGCCPNTNTHAYNSFSRRASLLTGAPSARNTAEGSYISRSTENQRLCCESRPLLNAIKNNREDVCQTLLGFSCPCCNGSGAKVTNIILDEAAKITPSMLSLMQANA